ncbi:MAG: PASTA domain-containing protein [Tannerella sp.]|jgi:cell division protein FtsI (penicillin-binding protein 3)|nr:PASTA domain-containing protein [Tannerella sp.]
MEKEELKKEAADREEPKELAAEKKQILTRYFGVILILGFFIGWISVSIGKIAFREKEKWLKAVEHQKKPNQSVMPDRGNIYSSDGKLMATSVPRYYLYMDFQADGFNVDSFMRSRTNGVDSLAWRLSKKLNNRTAKGYRDHLLRGLKSKSRKYPVYEGRVSYMDLKEIRNFPFFRKGRNTSGFYEQGIVQRQKFYGSLASRTVGDIYNEIETGGLPKGKNGLEQQHDSLLRGQHGVRSTIRVGRGWTNVMEQEPVSGMDVLTTIDLRIQDFTEKALIDKLRETDAEYGVAIVMEVRTGEIKAVSNIERLRPGSYRESQVRNFALTDQLEPGSTFKIPSIMVALEDKVCTPSDPVETGNGIYHYEGRKIVDHNANKGGYHQITVEQAIWYSSNIGVAKTILKGYRTNPKKFTDGLSRIGIDADLHIPGAGQPRIRTQKDPRWSKLTLPWTSFGYEVQITPIQQLAFYNAIANDGKMIQPVFTKEIRQNGKTVQRFSTRVIRPAICSQETLQTVRQMMLDVVEKGTGRDVHSDAVAIAGKTGTAQIASGGTYQSHQVSFCGYFPAEAPEYSCIVVIRRPRIGYPSGGAMSGGVFKAIAEKIYSGQTKIDLRRMESDSAGIFLPPVKSGDAGALDYVLDELDIRTEPRRAKAAQVAGVRRTDDGVIELAPLTVKDGMVPNVAGMGAKDAVYLLEKAGLRVKLSGRGTVVSQSVSPGQRAVKGQTVAITLTP